MKKRSLNRMIALPLMAVAFTCAAADLNAAGCAGTYQPYGGYASHGNYLPYGYGSGSALSPNMPTSIGSQSYSQIPGATYYQGTPSYYANQKITPANMPNYTSQFVGMENQNLNIGQGFANTTNQAWTGSSGFVQPQTNLQIGSQSYVQQNLGSSNLQGSYSQNYMQGGYGQQYPQAQSSGYRCPQQLGPCPSSYRTGYSSNFFDSPSIPISSNATYSLYGYGQNQNQSGLNQSNWSPSTNYNYSNYPMQQSQPYAAQDWNTNVQQSYGYSNLNQQNLGAGQYQGFSQNLNIPSQGQAFSSYDQNVSCPGQSSGFSGYQGHEQGIYNQGFSQDQKYYQYPQQGQFQNQGNFQNQGYGYSSMNQKNLQSNLSYQSNENSNNGYSSSSSTMDRSNRNNRSLFSDDEKESYNDYKNKGKSNYGYGYADTNSRESRSSSTNMNRSGQFAQPQQMNMPVVEILANNPQFSHFFRLLQASGELNRIGGAGPFTIFAPTNEAFSQLSKDKIQELTKPENREKLKEIINYHIVSGRYLSNELKDADLTTLSDESLDISGSNGDLKVSDARIVMPNLVGTNGVIHGVDTVLNP